MTSVEMKVIKDNQMEFCVVNTFEHLRQLVRANATAFGFACVVMCAGVISGAVGVVSSAHAGPADVYEKSDGSMIVTVPGEGDITVAAKDAKQIVKILRTENDEEAETNLAQLMAAGNASRIPALAIAAATQDPDRTALIVAAAIRADEAEGIKTAKAIRYVRGANKRQVLLGAHSSGNRVAYRKIRGAFAEDQQRFMAGGGDGGASNRNVGAASNRLERGLGLEGRGNGRLLNRFK